MQAENVTEDKKRRLHIEKEASSWWLTGDYQNHLQLLYLNKSKYTQL